MTTHAAENHRFPRRESSPSPRSSSKRRPRLLRACATEPSITTSNSCSGVLAAPNSNRRATEILSRVAVSNAASDHVLRVSPSSSPPSARSVVGLDPSERSGHHKIPEVARRQLIQNSHSACYFSFPSFDEWEEREHQAEEKANAA